MSATWKQLVERLGGRYGFPVVRAMEELRGTEDSAHYWQAVYNRAVNLADWSHVAESDAS